MKRLLILSSDKELKKSLTTTLNKAHSSEINCTTVSTRSNCITELSQKEFDGVLIHCDLSQIDLEIILKYLSTNEYYLCNIFFVSEDFEIFERILHHLNFPHINLISLPIETDELVSKISSRLFPQHTDQIDSTYKINLDFLKVFIDCTKKVFTDFCNLEKMAHGRPYLLTDENTVKYVVLGKIPLISDTFEGSFCIGFEEKYYLDLINKVLMIDATVIDNEILDFAAELVNMIYGQAKFVLNDAGHNFQKVLPRFILHPINPKNIIHVVVVPMISELGTFYIEIEVKKIKGMNI